MVVISTEGSPKTAGQTENGMKGKGIQLFSYSNVHIYFIDPQEHDTRTGPLLYPVCKRDTVTVRLVMIPLEDQNALSKVSIPPAFLEAGGWFYPLIPSKTPVYRTKEKYYIFPDLLASSGSSVGIVFPEEMKEDEKDLFESILLNLAGLDEFPTGFADQFGNPGGLITNSDAAYAVSDETSEAGYSIRSVAQDLGECIVEMAKDTEDGITTGATKMFEFMSNGTGQAKCNLKSGYKSAKEYSGNAVQISGDAVIRLADATSKVAAFSSHRVKRAASSGMETVYIECAKGTEALQNGINAVGERATNSMGIVYEALHNAGKTLAHAIMHNNVLDHRYGAGRGHIMEVGPKALVTFDNDKTIGTVADLVQVQN